MPPSRYRNLSKSLGSSDPNTSNGEKGRLGFIKLPNGNWLYDHKQDLQYLAANLERIALRAMDREIEDAMPREPVKNRITIANAPRDVVVAALHRIKRL